MAGFGGRVWVGADPGGKNNFGIALLNSSGATRSACVDCADQAIDWLQCAMQASTTVAGAGVDCPLWWSSGPSGGRSSDQWLRDTYRLSGGQVQASNSLKGAALVQGAMFVVRLRERFPSVPVTESHPKALLSALRIPSLDSFANQFGLKAPIESASLHERDAVVSAVAAREGFEGRWAVDLTSHRGPSEQDPASYWLAPVHYFWPGP